MSTLRNALYWVCCIISVLLVLLTIMIIWLAYALSGPGNSSALDSLGHVIFVLVFAFAFGLAAWLVKPASRT